MNILKKVLLSSVFSFMCVVPLKVKAQTASEKPEAVLFKIHDVTPIEDEKGSESGCDFLITFYNRSAIDIKQAVLKLSYNDQVSGKYFAQSENDQAAPETLTITVNVPELGSYKQLMLKQHVKTDKCFLLLTDPQSDLASCSGESQAAAPEEQAPAQTTSRRASRAARRVAPAQQNTEKCPAVFDYISPNNPEYYSEFKEISYEEQQRLLSDEKKIDLTELRDTYSRVTNKLQEANSITHTIQ